MGSNRPQWFTMSVFFVVDGGLNFLRCVPLLSCKQISRPIDDTNKPNPYHIKKSNSIKQRNNLSKEQQ